MHTLISKNNKINRLNKNMNNNLNLTKICINVRFFMRINDKNYYIDSYIF